MATGLSQRGGMQGSMRISESGRTKRDQTRAHLSQGPCPAQQATLCDSHQEDPGEHGGTSTHFLGQTAVQPTESDRETVCSSVIAKWLLVKSGVRGPSPPPLRPVLLFLSACSPKCGYGYSHFP